ncbi:Transposase, probably fragment [gamma proteobacterium HdN1]|nr:Transposase, probably fragment [gamma proteobacterium HdN1]
MKLNCWEEVDKGHGRIETRHCIASDRIDWLEQKAQWAGLRSVAMIDETRESGGKKQCGPAVLYQQPATRCRADRKGGSRTLNSF